MLKRLFKNKSKQFKAEYWLEARKGMLKYIPRAFFTPMCSEEKAFNFIHKQMHLSESRTDKILDKPTLKICSYNIWRNYQSKDIKKSLKQIFQKSDIVLIQEDAYRQDEGQSSQDFTKGWDHAYTRIHAPIEQTEYYDFEHSGQSTFSRYKINKSKTYTLPLNHTAIYAIDHLIMRTILYTQINHTNGQTIGVYNVHLSNLTGPSGRNREIKYILEVVSENQDDHVIIGGDFNTYMGPFETAVKTLKKAGFCNGAKTFWKPMSLDHIFVSNTIQGKQNIKLELNHSGSDHQPTDIVEIIL